MNKQRLSKNVSPAPCRTQGVRGAADTLPGSHRPATATSARSFHRPKREGRGGEKAAQGDASLPVPPAPHPPRQSNTPAQAGTSSAPGEGERKCEGVFPQKSGKSRSYFRGSHSRGPAPAADPYPAPAPCRTQGVRGAADTPPASHEFAPCLPRVRHLPPTSSPPAFHGLAPLPPTGPRPPYPRCQKPEYMVLRYCMGDIPVWRRKIR